MPEHDWPRSTGDRQPGSDVIVWSVTVDDEAVRESERLLSADATIALSTSIGGR